MEVENQSSSWNGYVDWRSRPAVKGRHGGMVAASFVLVVEVLENLAFLANASNLVRYLSQYMHFSPSESANSVTNFMGTSFLLALLGGFLSDAFFTTFVIYLISAAIEFLVWKYYREITPKEKRPNATTQLDIALDLLGLVILTIQARSKSLKPPHCDKSVPNVHCDKVHGGEAAMLFTGLYLVALGVGGIKGSLAPHGAEQLDEDAPKGRKQRSTFFNYFVFCLASGALIAVTFVVWVEDNRGWEWGFGISTMAIFLSIPVFLSGSTFYRNKIPTGSPLTTIVKVLIAATMNACSSRSSRNVIASMNSSPYMANAFPQEAKNGKDVERMQTPSGNLKFLNRAIQDEPPSKGLQCSVQQVEDVKIVIQILPIFGCTIMLSCCLAQLSTYSVEQAASMDRTLGSMKVPPASLPIFPVVFIMILAPIYDHFIVPFTRRVTKSEMGISHLQRIGVGLIMSIIAMAIAALVEIKRRNVATDSGLIDSKQPLPLTFLWIAFQYLFLGSADLFTLAGLLEFFFTEAPTSMRSLATSLSWASLAMGYYLSTLIVSIVNGVTGDSSNRAWLSGHNLNRYRLDLFYWLMCGLSTLNFFHYLFWAMRYKYKGPARDMATSNNNK